jgi:uncharacterized protein (DUF1810 family)
MECIKAVCAHKNRTANSIFGSPDDEKFHASLTLFSRAAADAHIFKDALDQFFGGQFHSKTLDILSRS